MTRKKKPPPQSKRHAITDAAGWTHITRGPSSTLNTAHTKHLLQHERIRRPSLTLAAYTHKYNSHYTPTWQQSACAQSLTHMLETAILPTSSIPITRCVCLGLGSPTAGIEASSWELAALVGLLEVLSKPHHEIHPVTFQDPVFNPTDHAFLASLGTHYTTVPDPAAFALIDPATFLFAPHLEWAHLARAVEAQQPALCICGDIEAFVEDVAIAKTVDADVCGVLRRFTEGRMGRALPAFEAGHDWCYFLCVYWVAG